MAGKKRLIFLIGSLEPAGAERVLVDSVKALRDFYDIEVVVVYEFLDNPNSLVSEMRSMVPVRSLIRYKRKGSFLERLPYRVGSRIKLELFNRVNPKYLYKVLFGRTNFDIEVAFLEGWPTRLLSGSPEGKAKTIAWVHTDMILNPWSLEHYSGEEEERRAYERFDKVLAVSSDVAGSIEKKYGIEAEFVQNIIDDASVRTKAEGDFSFDEDGGVHIVTVGRLTQVKGYDRLVRVAAKLKEEGVRFCIHMVGGGAMEDELRQLVGDLGLQGYVVFEGYQKNPYPYIKAADLLVCSSYAEGFSGVVVEAIILGTPVLTTRCAGMVDILGTDDLCGVIVDNSEEGLRDGLSSLLNDPERLARYRDGAAKRGSDFSTAALAEKTMRVLEE